MFIAELGLSKFRCKGTTIYAHAQKNMLQKMLRTLHCNKCNIFCNKISIYKCFILARTGQVPEVFLIAFGEIARIGETKLHGNLLHRHVCRAQ